MNSTEREEIKRLPKKYKPMSTGAYVFYSLFWTVPILGWISFIVNAIKGKSIAKRNYARSFIVFYVLAFIAGVVLGILIAMDMIPVGDINNFNPSDI